MTIDIASELLGSGAPTLKFAAEGDTHSIIIRGFEKKQETSFDTGEPISWPSGDPKWQYVITGESDGEESRLFVKGYMVDALKEALRKADAKPGEDLTGWKFTVKWSSTEEPRRAGMQGARKYVAKLERAKAVVDIDLI